MQRGPSEAELAQAALNFILRGSIQASEAEVLMMVKNWLQGKMQPVPVPQEDDKQEKAS